MHSYSVLLDSLWSQGLESFPRKNTGVGYHFLIQGISQTVIKPASPALQVNSLPLNHSVQSLSHVWLFATPWTTARQASLSITNSQSSPKHMSNWVSGAIQPSHPLSSPSLPALNLSQHQGLFKWVSSSHQVAKVLEFELQHQSFQWSPRTDLL